MRPIRAGLVIATGMAAVLSVVVATQAMAAAVATEQYTVTLATGLRGFTTDFPAQTVNPNTGVFTGSNVNDTSNRTTVPAFDQRYGVFQNIGRDRRVLRLPVRGDIFG